MIDNNIAIYVAKLNYEDEDLVVITAPATGTPAIIPAEVNARFVAYCEAGGIDPSSEEVMHPRLVNPRPDGVYNLHHADY